MIISTNIKAYLIGLIIVMAVTLTSVVHASPIKEYKIVSAHKFLDRKEVEAELNRLAELGWIVKAVVPRILNGTNSFTDIYLERDKPEKD